MPGNKGHMALDKTKKNFANNGRKRGRGRNERRKVKEKDKQ